MKGCIKGEFSIRIDQQRKCLLFGKSIFDYNSETRTVCLPADEFRTRLQSFCCNLQNALTRANPELLKIKKQMVNDAFKEAFSQIAVDRETTIYRRQLIEQKIEEREVERARKEVQRQARALELQQIEEKRLAEQEKIMAAERLKQQRKEIERSESLKLAEKITAQLLEKNVKIKEDEMQNTEKLMELQAQQIEKERRELALKSKSLMKTLDHTVRAFQQEEIPLLQDDYKAQMKADEKAYQLKKLSLLEAAKEKHMQNIVTKKRVLRILDDYYSFKSTLETERKEKYDILLAEAEEKINIAKQERIAEYEQKRKVEEEKKAKEAKLAEIENRSNRNINNRERRRKKKKS
jgi:translation initiation factor 3 subunit A